MVRVSLPDATWVVTELCVDDVCVTADVVGSQMYVPVSSDSPSSYPYRLALTTPDGRDLQFSGTVKTERYRVNGPGCEPVTANAVLKVGADGQLTAGAEPDG